MSINYVMRKKVDKSGEEEKTLYYAVPYALQKSGVNEQQIGDYLQERSSLTAGDVLSTLEQLPAAIAHFLKDGRTVTIRGLGTFYPAISSEGFDNPRKCKPNHVILKRICFRTDKKFLHKMANTRFQQISEPGARERKKKSGL
ncbi:MAG: DNA-binding protein [Bacteroides sp.]|nr:DNA-binding protein [Bacteroides sp.]